MEDVRQITQAIADGDRDALATFYEQRFNVVLGMARRHVGIDEHLALDIVQDTMMRFIHHRPVFNDGRALDAWLGRTVRHVTIDIIRAERRRRRRELATAESIASAASTEPRAAPRPDIDWLRDELERLDELSRDLLEDRYRFGHTLSRVSERLGVTVSTVHARLNRTLESLRRRASEIADE